MSSFQPSHLSTRGTTEFQPQQPHSNLIFIWSCKKKENSQPDISFFEQFSNELSFIHEKEHLTVTFPDIFEDMTADPNSQCEIRISNVVQKSKIFYQHNTVTQDDLFFSNKKVANGKVLIIVNESVENRFSDKTEEEKKDLLKKLYVYLTMKNK